MIDIKQTNQIIRECLNFTQEHSAVASNHSNVNVCAVDDLKAMLLKRFPSDLLEILQKYPTLDRYISVVNSRYELPFDWDFVVMTYSEYKLHQQYPSILQKLTARKGFNDQTRLFVIYKQRLFISSIPSPFGTIGAVRASVNNPSEEIGEPTLIHMMGGLTVTPTTSSSLDKKRLNREIVNISQACL
jgi:hypothetical protein